MRLIRRRVLRSMPGVIDRVAMAGQGPSDTPVSLCCAASVPPARRAPAIASRVIVMAPLFVRILIVVGLAWWLLVGVGLLPSPFSRTTIRIRNGQIRIAGADLPSRAREHVADVVREAGLHGGFITMSKARRVIFSRGIPEGIRQRLRNILLN